LPTARPVVDHILLVDYFHKFFIDKIAGVGESTDASGSPASRHLPEDVALNLFKTVDYDEVISLISSA